MSYNSQKGTSITEALIAVVLVALLTKGAAYLTTRATASHTDQQLLSLAINQMNYALESNSVCSAAPIIELPNNISLTSEVQGCDTTSATINGMVIDNVATPPILSVTSDLLGGQVVVGGTWVD